MTCQVNAEIYCTAELPVSCTHCRAPVSVTPQSETDLVDKSGRSLAVPMSTAATPSSKTGRDAKSYVELH